MISYKVARRSFVQGLGAGSAALLVPLLRSIEARAAGNAAPLRFLIIQHPLGCWGEPAQTKWYPKVNGNTWDFSQATETAPFAPLQKYMCMVNGINMVTAGTGNDATGGDNTHEGGMCALMTGVPTIGMSGVQDHCAGGPSIDRLFWNQSPTLGGPKSMSPTPQPTTLYLGADTRSDRAEVAPSTMTYDAPKQGVSDPASARTYYTPVLQPLDTYNQYFAKAALDAGVSGGQMSTQLLAQQQSVLTYLNQDLKRMQGLIPASEKPKLDAHANALASLEATIQGMYSSSDAGAPGTAAGCMRPSMPPDYAYSSTGTQTGGPDDQNGGNVISAPGYDYFVPNNPSSHPFQDVGLTNLRLIKAAFQCDMFRVATFLWTAGTNWVVFPGTFQGAVIKGSLQSAPHHPPSHTTDAQVQDWLVQINNYFSAQTSTILQEFASTTDVDGNSLLDNTVVVYVTEVSRARDHDQRNLPVIVFGGKNTKINGGTIVNATGGPLSTLSGGTGNRPMNDVWLALAPIFNVAMTSLGTKSGGHSSGQSNVPQSTGPLPGIVAGT